MSDASDEVTFYPIGMPETEICSKCGQGTGWAWDELEGWTSVCCARPPKALPDDA